MCTAVGQVIMRPYPLRSCSSMAVCLEPVSRRLCSSAGRWECLLKAEIARNHEAGTDNPAKAVNIFAAYYGFKSRPISTPAILSQRPGRSQ